MHWKYKFNAHKTIKNLNIQGLLTMLSLCTASSFIPDDTVIHEACPEFLILDVDVAEDEDIDILD